MTADATAAAAALPVHTGTFAALRYGGYRRLLLGTTLANGGQWLQQVTVSWLAYDITGSGTSVGTVNLFRSFATLGSAPWAGLAVDRVSPRQLIIAINLWLAILSAVVGAFLMGGERHLWLLFAFAFGSGIATAVDQPLRQAAVFLIVPRPVAPNAVALMQTGWGLMRSVGPAVGGLLIALVGPGGNFLLQSAVYGLILLNGLTIAFPPRGGTRAAPSFLRNLAEGIRYVKGAAETRTFVMMGWILPLLIIPTFTALPPIYAKEVFHVGSLTLGLLLSAVGVGAIVGGLFAASLNAIVPTGELVVVMNQPVEFDPTVIPARMVEAVDTGLSITSPDANANGMLNTLRSDSNANDHNVSIAIAGNRITFTWDRNTALATADADDPSWR